MLDALRAAGLRKGKAGLCVPFGRQNNGVVASTSLASMHDRALVHMSARQADASQGIA